MRMVSCTRLMAFILLGVSLTGCMPLQLYTNRPEGPPEYTHGYDDGCKTGVAKEGDFWHKMFYGMTKDPEMFNNALYKQGWNEGYVFCGGYYSSLRDDDVFGQKGWGPWGGGSAW